MAMLRVSSYRRLFEDDPWGRRGGTGGRCAGQYQALVRSKAVDDCDCDQLDFVAAKELNREGLSCFIQDRSVIADLNNRLVRLIQLARCFEEENETIECRIVELEEKLKSRPASSGVTSSASVCDFSLDAVVERLIRERDEIVCDTEALQKELERLMMEHEKTAQRKILLQQGRQAVAEEVDVVTAECLALREQVAIYEEQLANMEAQQKMAVEGLLYPDEHATGSVADIKFSSPDITAALDVKELYCQLAESLQFDCGATSSAVIPRGDGKQLEVGGAAGLTIKDPAKIKDVGEMKMLISELQKELAELEQNNEELEDEMDMKKAENMEEVADLQCTIDDMHHQEDDFQAQMKEQCDDYKVLLSEKMAREMEITAYRSLVEGEEERLCLI